MICEGKKKKQKKKSALPQDSTVSTHRKPLTCIKDLQKSMIEYELLLLLVLERSQAQVVLGTSSHLRWIFSPLGFFYVTVTLS